ncbi:hypothetical protein RND81_03G061100 [Saponaria officinalis]|uniref:Inositol polyphosphate-related phosphatase domain-containing protein n=1 Tax=Saponaria officinalis TaxID=3572 RepID=A0AAW1M3V0_SAPOF
MQPRYSRRGSLELLWPRVVLRKLLNFSSKHSDFGADSEIDDIGDDDDQTILENEGDEDEENEEFDHDDLPRIRRRKSETFRAQYINTKDLRVCVGTWNVGGKRPPDDLDIEEWLNIDEPSDIYVLGLQEIVPLNAGNIFGSEDNRPVLKWESIIRKSLSKVHPAKIKKIYKSYSDPPSPSKFKPSDDILDFEDELLLETDSDCEEIVHPVVEEPCGFYEVRDKIVDANNTLLVGEITCPETFGQDDIRKQFSTSDAFDRKPSFQSGVRDGESVLSTKPINAKLSKTLSGTERIGLSWPEPPLNLVAQRVLERPHPLKSTKSLKSSKSLRTYNSFKMTRERRTVSSRVVATALSELDLESLIQWRRRKPEYVRIVSKQMIGIFLTVWVRKNLRKHIQNLKVSTVGVGVMGYIGNKGSVSVSMSIYQTLFCFICTHLTSGEKEIEQHKRNADVHEIHRRTLFRSDTGLGVPKSIYDHEKIIWLGDLNYRISLSFDETRQLMSRKEWPKLVEKDQLVRELRKGRVFDGWCEGALHFPPTYKYEIDSDNYTAGEPKAARRTPAWCDRVLSFGKGITLIEYKRSELKLSDHRPVTAIYDIEVEVFSCRKLQKALTLTDAEIQNGDILTHKAMDPTLSELMLEEASTIS